MSNKVRHRVEMPLHLDKYLPFLRKLTDEQAYNLFEKGTGLNFDYDLPPIDNVKIKSVWQNAGGKWLTSYKANEGINIDYDEMINGVIKDLKKFTPKKVKLLRENKKIENLYVLSIPDLHFGKEPIKETLSKLDFVVGDLLGRVSTTNNKFVFVVGNDLLNSDTANYTTTKGTPQFDYEKWKDSFRSAWGAMVNVIDTVIPFGSVDVVNVPGNHDYIKGFTVGEVLAAYYSLNKNVIVNNINDDRKYFEYGKLLFGFDHGEIRKSQDYENLMANEKPQMWGRTEHRTWFLGHLHHEWVKAYKSVTVRYLPSICNTDDWHKKAGYVQGKQGKAAQLYQYDINNGLRAIYQVTA